MVRMNSAGGGYADDTCLTFVRCLNKFGHCPIYLSVSLECSSYGENGHSKLG